ncbi:MAG: phenylalanine--tRNA ligase subunit beta [Acidobacteriia bacterium]|nr:phenylalanine--tRNA ligase subunit beta [Terriglobia bacterium]
MRISPQWLKQFVDLKVSDAQLAEDLTLAGVAVESVRQQEGQMIFEMEITTNRPDAMCHYGVARECSAIYDIPLKPLTVALPKERPAAKPFPIEIQDSKGCLRYTARVVRGVKIGPSPAKILDHLKIEEQNGISNAVDASNYTLMEMGHPTHAFDLDKLEGGKIIVRRARAGETLKTLDGVDRKLTTDDLIIADAVKPVALAGVMGGLDSAISAGTKNILIESAWFEPASVRKTARYHGMHTDASHIFERGADWGATTLACDRVAALVLESAGGELEDAPVDVIAGHVVRHSLWLRTREVERQLGVEISAASIARILTRLGFKKIDLAATLPRGVAIKTMTPEMMEAYKARAKELGITLPDVQMDPERDIAIDLPTWRLDIEREIDLIEEIARIYGYNKFPNTLPSFSGGVVELPHAASENKLRSALLSLGYNEAISPTFISPADAAAFSHSNDPAVTLANPLSDEQSVMRTSLVPGMLNMLAWNLNRGTNDVCLFETGNVFSMAGEKSSERKTICIGATGSARMASVHETAKPYSFFDLKGAIESVLGVFEIGKLSFDAQAGGYYHPGRSARAVADGQTVARFGEIHPDVAAARKLRQEVYVAEIDLARLLRFALRVPRYVPLSRFPSADRDFSFVFDDSVRFDQILAAVQSLKIAELQRFSPAEIFRGGAVPQGKYSVLLRAQFQSAERTLRDDEVAQWSAQIIQALEALGGTLRS